MGARSSCIQNTFNEHPRLDEALQRLATARAVGSANLNTACTLTPVLRREGRLQAEKAGLLAVSACIARESPLTLVHKQELPDQQKVNTFMRHTDNPINTSRLAPGQTRRTAHVTLSPWRDGRKFRRTFVRARQLQCISFELLFALTFVRRARERRAGWQLQQICCSQPVLK